MIVHIKGKKNTWEFKYYNKEVIDNKYSTTWQIALPAGYYYKTKDNIYILSFNNCGFYIARLYYQDKKPFWFSNPYSKYAIEKIEFSNGNYTSFNSARSLSGLIY